MIDKNISDEKLKELFVTAGISTDKLKNVDKNKLNQILANPEKVKEIMSTPEAQALLKRFTNK